MCFHSQRDPVLPHDFCLRLPPHPRKTWYLCLLTGHDCLTPTCGFCLLVCNLLFITRYMRPEGPWQWLVADSGGLFKNNFSYPGRARAVTVGHPHQLVDFVAQEVAHHCVSQKELATRASLKFMTEILLGLSIPFGLQVLSASADVAGVPQLNLFQPLLLSSPSLLDRCCHRPTDTAHLYKANTKNLQNE